MLFFGRTEVYLGYSAEEYQRRRSLLEQAGIPTEGRVVTRTGGGGFSSQWGRGNRQGSHGLDRDYCSQYYLYVRRGDGPKAKALLGEG